MSIDYEALAKGMAAAVPFNSHLGLEYVSIGPGEAVVRLPDDEALRNHVGSQHAGGLFSAGEAASGGAFVGTFAERMGDITPLAAAANIETSIRSRAIGWRMHPPGTTRPFASRRPRVPVQSGCRGTRRHIPLHCTASPVAAGDRSLRSVTEGSKVA